MIIIFWEMTPCGSYKNQEPHGVISQKMIIIIVTAVETSNLTNYTQFTENKVTTLSNNSLFFKSVLCSYCLYHLQGFAKNGFVATW
jgi:hypothetical protein